MAICPTEEAWNYFMLHHDDIFDVCETFLPIPRMQVPNTRIAITYPDGQEIVTDERAAIPLPISNTIADFHAAVENKDTHRLMLIMNSAWLRAPEDRSVYRMPGFTEMCNLLDGTVDGFVDMNGPDLDEVDAP